MIEKMLYISSNKVIVYFVSNRAPITIETKNGTALECALLQYDYLFFCQTKAA